MSRLKLRDNRKAQSVPLSLMPKHVVMLEELVSFYRKNRSKVVQKLIEEAYTSKIGKDSDNVQEQTTSEAPYDPSDRLQELIDA